jgi:hypothetical protein
MRDYMGTGSVFHLFSRLIYGPINLISITSAIAVDTGSTTSALISCKWTLSWRIQITTRCESLTVPKDVLPAKV